MFHMDGQPCWLCNWMPIIHVQLDSQLHNWASSRSILYTLQPVTQLRRDLYSDHIMQPDKINLNNLPHYITRQL